MPHTMARTPRIRHLVCHRRTARSGGSVAALLLWQRLCSRSARAILSMLCCVTPALRHSCEAPQCTHLRSCEITSPLWSRSMVLHMPAVARAPTCSSICASRSRSVCLARYRAAVGRCEACDDEVCSSCTSRSSAKGAAAGNLSVTDAGGGSSVPALVLRRAACSTASWRASRCCGMAGSRHSGVRCDSLVQVFTCRQVNNPV